MQRTISAMVGKGSVNHNSRKFRAENVDGTRTHLNIDYCNENIKTVYHELFDEALERYNAKQTRSDRKIKDYYEKIRSSKQEKPFREIILQVGGKGNMNADTENGELAKQVLDEYYQGFQERNPQLRVFSAHLHMDEATPHVGFNVSGGHSFGIHGKYFFFHVLSYGILIFFNQLWFVITVTIPWDRNIHISITGVHGFAGMTVSAVVCFFVTIIILGIS